jgi:hypothetical protein
VVDIGHGAACAGRRRIRQVAVHANSDEPPTAGERARGRSAATTGTTNMLDILYILGTRGFVALMLAYVRGCEVLGQEAEPAERAS